MKFSNYLFPCSYLSKIMSNSKEKITDNQVGELNKLLFKENPTEKQQKRLEELLNKHERNGSVILSSGCKSFLVKVWAKEKYGARYKIRGGKGVPQLVRGVGSETDAVALLSVVDKKKYYRDKKKISNEFISGVIDIMDAPTIEQSTRVLDVKSSFAHINFIAQTTKPELSNNLSMQMKGYLAITKKEIGEVAFCLVDFPESIIQEQRSLIFDEMCPDGIPTQQFIKYWEKAEASMRFRYLPPKERVLSYLVYPDEDFIESTYITIEACRKWLQEFDEQYFEVIARRYMNE
jgi:hypothetical protein